MRREGSAWVAGERQQGCLRWGQGPLGLQAHSAHLFQASNSFSRSICGGSSGGCCCCRCLRISLLYPSRSDCDLRLTSPRHFVSFFPALLAGSDTMQLWSLS